jgi:hypothetical protein
LSLLPLLSLSTTAPARPLRQSHRHALLPALEQVVVMVARGQEVGLWSLADCRCALAQQHSSTRRAGGATQPQAVRPTWRILGAFHVFDLLGSSSSRLQLASTQAPGLVI